MYNFTEEEVIYEIRKTFFEPMCMDMMEDARKCDTLKQAADTIIIDSALWNGTF